MALRALRDTYGTESIYGAEVRRFIKAGTVIPPHYQVDLSEFEEVSGGSIVIGRLDTANPPASSAQPVSRDYGGMTMAELKEEAARRGIVVTDTAKKADLLAALEK